MSKVFMGQTAFLLPNQQCQGTEGNITSLHWNFVWETSVRQSGEQMRASNPGHSWRRRLQWWTIVAEWSVKVTRVVSGRLPLMRTSPCLLFTISTTQRNVRNSETEAVELQMVFCLQHTRVKVVGTRQAHHTSDSAFCSYWTFPWVLSIC